MTIAEAAADLSRAHEAALSVQSDFEVASELAKLMASFPKSGPEYALLKAAQWRLMRAGGGSIHRDGLPGAVGTAAAAAKRGGR